jgi:predicted phosphohydrolase
MNLHGHLHTSNREEEMFGNTKVYNVSLLDEDYKMVFKPQYFEI